MSPCPLKELCFSRTFAVAERDRAKLVCRTGSSMEMRCTSTESISCEEAQDLSLDESLSSCIRGGAGERAHKLEL